MYEITKILFTCFNGRKLEVGIREGTADFNAIQASLVEDEYDLKTYHFKNDDIIIDIGAATGGEAMAIAATNPETKIYSYEPLRENYELLKSNITDNGFRNVKAIQKAVMGYSGKCKISYGDPTTENGRHHYFIGNALNQPLGEKKETECISLEEIFINNDIQKCKMVKLDPEGVEYEIIKNCPKEILGKIDYIIGEHHNIKRSKLHELVSDQFTDEECSYKSEENIGHFKFKNKKQ